MPNVQGQVGQSVGVPTLPSVNLMPPEIAEAARFRRFQLAMGGAVVAAFVVVGALYMQAHGSVATARDQLQQAQAQQTQLQSQLNSLQSVQDTYAEVAQRQAMLTTAMGQEIRWSSYLNDLSLRLPDKVWLTNVSATETNTGLAAAAGPVTSAAGAPLTTPGIGTITFSGVAFSHDDVATLLDTLAKERGFTNPYFTSSTEATIGPKGVVNYVATVDLNDKAKSGRYNKPAGS